jgi:hypothetical protein
MADTPPPPAVPPHGVGARETLGGLRYYLMRARAPAAARVPCARCATPPAPVARTATAGVKLAAATAGVKLAAATHDLRFSSTFDPSQHHQELQAVELRIPLFSPSPGKRRSAAAPCGPSRPPWSPAAGLFRPFPVASSPGEHVFEFPSFSSLDSPSHRRP